MSVLKIILLQLQLKQLKKVGNIQKPVRSEQ